jgi:hypothetical protein
MAASATPDSSVPAASTEWKHLLARFLGRLWKAWYDSSVPPRPPSPEPLDPLEPLSRFLTQSRQFAGDRVKPRAFLPAPDGITSSFRTRGLAEEGIWALGELRVASAQDGRLYGRGDLPVRSVTATGLRVDADDDPPRHAGIVGWPEDKDARTSRAQELAAAATLVLRSKIPPRG